MSAAYDANEVKTTMANDEKETKRLPDWSYKPVSEWPPSAIAFWNLMASITERRLRQQREQEKTG